MHPLIIAHRGASADAPENTLAAFKLAFEQGADGIEGDFRLTRDGQLACLHDPGTGRVAGRELVVSESTLAELTQVHPIPTLGEVLALVPEGKRIYIEVKSGLAIVEPLEKVLLESGLKPEQIVIISFVGNVISVVKKKMPHLKALLLTVFPVAKTGKAGAEGLINRVKTLQADGVDIGVHPRLDSKFVQAIHGNGLEAHVWTVDQPVEAQRLMEIGVDSITTNRPGLLRGRRE